MVNSWQNLLNILKMRLRKLEVFHESCDFINSCEDGVSSIEWSFSKESFENTQTAFELISGHL
jgi:hypothetical protein